MVSPRGENDNGVRRVKWIYAWRDVCLYLKQILGQLGRLNEQREKSLKHSSHCSYLNTYQYINISKHFVQQEESPYFPFTPLYRQISWKFYKMACLTVFNFHSVVSQLLVDTCKTHVLIAMDLPLEILTLILHASVLLSFFYLLVHGICISHPF